MFISQEYLNNYQIKTNFLSQFIIGDLLGQMTSFEVSTIGGISVQLLYKILQCLPDNAILSH